MPDLSTWQLWGSNLMRALAYLILLGLVYFLSNRTLGKLEQGKKLGAPLVVFGRKALRWIAVGAAILMILHAVGVLPGVWGMLTAVAAMVAIGFVAIWSVLSNALCAVFLIIMRPFRVGDEIEVTPDALKGKVVNFSLLFTTLQDEGGWLLKIPNNIFFQRVVKVKRGDVAIKLDEQLLKKEDAQI